MENKSTHFIFDGEKVLISPDLFPTINFLMEIEKEVKTILEFEKNLESIRKQYRETLGFIELLAEKLKENSINFEFTFVEHPSTIADKLKITRPIRSEAIVIFSNLEVLLRLNFAYDNKISDGDQIRKLSLDQKTWEYFYNNFCLNQNNEWAKNNQERCKYITAMDLRYLRNSVTHFFSLDKGLGLSYAIFDEKSRRLEEATNFKAKFITPEDLYGIVKGTARLMIEKWSKDCEDSFRKNSNEFKERILCVNELIKNSGAVIVKSENINI